MLRPALLVAGLILAALALRAVPGLNQTALEARVGHGLGGMAWLVIGGGVACAAGFPRWGVAFAGALLFGFWQGGILLSMIAQLIGCGLSFYWARLLARNWAQARLQRGRMGRFTRFIVANPFTATLMLRLLPVGNNLALNLLAGVTQIGFPPFLAASAIGYLPQTAVFALLGSGVRLGRSSQLALAAALFVLSGLCGLLLMRRSRLNAPEVAAV